MRGASLYNGFTPKGTETSPFHYHGTQGVKEMGGYSNVIHQTFQFGTSVIEF